MNKFSKKIKLQIRHQQRKRTFLHTTDIKWLCSKRLWTATIWQLQLTDEKYMKIYSNSVHLCDTIKKKNINDMTNHQPKCLRQSGRSYAKYWNKNMGQI